MLIVCEWVFFCYCWSGFIVIVVASSTFFFLFGRGNLLCFVNSPPLSIVLSLLFSYNNWIFIFDWDDCLDCDFNHQTVYRLVNWLNISQSSRFHKRIEPFTNHLYRESVGYDFKRINHHKRIYNTFGRSFNFFFEYVWTRELATAYAHTIAIINGRTNLIRLSNMNMKHVWSQ